MKKLLFLLTLLIFACNSDDSNDYNSNNNSNQTILGRFDGVVWEHTVTTPDGENNLGRFMITQEPNIFYEYYSAADPNCISFSFEIIENSIDLLNIQVIDGNSSTNLIITYENNGDYITTVQSNGPTINRYMTTLT